MSSFLQSILVYIRLGSLDAPILTIGHIDERNDYSVIHIGVVEQSGLEVRPLPRRQQKHTVWVEKAGLVNPRHYVTLTCDIPELGAVGESMTVQAAKWDNPLVHIVIGRRFLERFRNQASASQAPMPTNLPPLEAARVTPLMVARPPNPQLLFNGNTAADSTASMMAQHGNNSPPMHNGSFLSPISAQASPNRPERISPRSHFGSFTGSAVTSSQGNVFSRNISGPSSASSFLPAQTSFDGDRHHQQYPGAFGDEDFSCYFNFPTEEGTDAGWED